MDILILRFTFEPHLSRRGVTSLCVPLIVFFSSSGVSLSHVELQSFFLHFDSLSIVVK